MKFTFSKNFNPKFPLIFPVFSSKKKPAPSGKMAFDRLVEKMLEAKVFEGMPGETHLHACEQKNMPKNIIFVSLGDPEKLKAPKLLGYLGGAVKKVKQEKGNELSFHLPKQLESFGETIAEAFELASYDPARYKTGKEARKRKEHQIEMCAMIGNPSKTFREAVAKGNLIAQATNLAREWVNGPPNIVGPEFFEEEAKKIAQEFGYGIRILRKKELEKIGMNGILAVNRGSIKEPRLIILEYKPDLENTPSDREKPIVIAGKGIIFDSGGYNLKPSGYIEDMHLDMAGAAATLALFRLLKILRVPYPVIALMPVTENCIDANAYKPSEIITMYDGKTVEITNTDAEGRLILGDALAYAVKEYKPRYLIDIATLTGACMVALGDRYAGLFSNDPVLRKLLRKAGDQTDELTWPLPIHPDFAQSMKGEISDLRNGEDSPRYAGASKAASFLKEFIGKTKWAHLDIAGVAYVKNPKKYETKRATGFGVRLLIRFLELLAQV